MRPSTQGRARGVFRLAAGSAAAIGVGAVGGLVWLASQGISARPQPGEMETSVARRARHLLIPAQARATGNPLPATPEGVRAGLEHFADHCASCHGNDGSGDTTLGRSLYPRAPDMRLPATQDLSDGELFYIIEEGVRLTGMPAWSNGAPEGEQASWRLVHFIRHLPDLTSDELDLMRTLNPRSAGEWRQEETERRFLAGEPDEPPPAHSTHQPGGPQ